MGSEEAIGGYAGWLDTFDELSTSKYVQLNVTSVCLGEVME